MTVQALHTLRTGQKLILGLKILKVSCKNKEGCSSTTACEKTRMVEEVEQKVSEVETAYSTVLDYTAPYRATHRQHVSAKYCAT